METDYQQIMTEVVRKSESEIILFFVLAIVAMVIFIIPLYRMILKDRKEKQAQENLRQDKYIERERQIIEVIKENSSVIAGLKVTLEQSGAATKSSLDRINEQIDIQHMKIIGMASDMTQVKLTLDSSRGDLKEVASKISQISIIMDGTSNSGSFLSQKEGNKRSSVKQVT